MLSTHLSEFLILAIGIIILVLLFCVDSSTALPPQFILPMCGVIGALWGGAIVQYCQPPSPRPIRPVERIQTRMLSYQNGRIVSEDDERIGSEERAERQAQREAEQATREAKWRMEQAERDAKRFAKVPENRN